jgi:DNA-binding MarR family transcriptional regulator
MPQAQSTPLPSRQLHDHIVARTCRLADAMLRMSSRQIKELWQLRNTDLRLLNILDQGESLTVTQISRLALVDQAWVSRSLRALKARALVDKRADPNDSRRTLFSLTERGRKILDESRPYAAWTEDVLLRDIDARQLKSLLDKLEANTQGLVEFVAAAPDSVGQK